MGDSIGEGGKVSKEEDFIKMTFKTLRIRGPRMNWKTIFKGRR